MTDDLGHVEMFLEGIEAGTGDVVRVILAHDTTDIEWRHRDQHSHRLPDIGLERKFHFDSLALIGTVSPVALRICTREIMVD